jgi:thiol-disulfide isomerase/thioredoxin
MKCGLEVIGRRDGGRGAVTDLARAGCAVSFLPQGLVSIVLAFGLGLAGLIPFATAKTPGEVEIGEIIRDATMQGLNGPSRKLTDFRGKPLLINVWASWCGPCQQEMASLERLAWQDHKIPFAVIGISTDDYPEKAKALLDRTHATISHFIDRQLQLENLLGASRLPLTVLVDGTGRVVAKIYGAREWDSVESSSLIAKNFGQPKATPAR